MLSRPRPVSVVMLSLRRPRKMAPGVTFGSSNVAIQILLADNAPVKNNTYRDAIIDKDSDHQPVRVEEFAELVRCNRPRWLIDYIEAEARKNINQTGVMQRLKAFLDEL